MPGPPSLALPALRWHRDQEVLPLPARPSQLALRAEPQRMLTGWRSLKGLTPCEDPSGVVRTEMQQALVLAQPLRLGQQALQVLARAQALEPTLQ